MEYTNNINRRQFGFREGVGTIQALDALTRKIKHNKTTGNHQLVVGLDLKNAFHSVWETYISMELEKALVPTNIRKIC